MTLRVGMLVTHPVQYLAPWFRQLATRVDLEVFYAHRQDAKGQAQAGFGVEFEWDTPLLDGYRYRWLKNVARRPGLGRFSGCDTPEIETIVEEQGFDAFVVFGWNNKSYLQAIRACWRHGVPAYIRGDSQLATRRSLPWRWVKRVLYRVFLPRLGSYLVVGQRSREYLAHYGVPGNRIFFVPHFVDAAAFRNAALMARDDGTAQAIRAKCGILADQFLVLFVGKLIAKKRPQDLILACHRLAALQPEMPVQCMIIGDGPLRGTLEKFARGGKAKICFAGFQNQSKLPAYYAAGNVLVLPSNAEETWGLVVNEAQACGRPAIVSTEVGCASDLVDGELTGYVFPVGDVDALAQRILQMQSLLATRPQAVEAALSKKVGTYSLDSATEFFMKALAVGRPLAAEAEGSSDA